MSNRTMMRGRAYAPRVSKVSYAITRLGGGTTGQGVSYPGGLDQLTPSLMLQAGSVRDGVNFEVSANGGYGRIQGYERFDGQTAPSSATFAVVQVDAFTNVPAVGDTITQASSGAFGTVAAVVNDTTDSIFYMVVTQVTGGFDSTGAVTFYTTSYTVTAANSPLTITAANSPFIVPFSTTPIGTAITQTVTVTSLLNAQYTAAAADIYRDLIGAVPGSGAVLGVVGMTFSGVDNVYAFRANETNTLVLLWKSTTAGWVNVPFFSTVDFTAGGTSEPVDGETLIQGAVHATIKRSMWQAGSFIGGTATGTFVVANQTGGNFIAGAATTASGSTVTLSGPQTAITLRPGGHFEFVKCNFSGQLITRRIYGCDGINKCFELDGETLAPITTGLSPDAPTHIAFHKNFLFVSQAASLIYCGVGEPFKWGANDGGGEIATGDTVTGMITLPGSQTSATLAVYLRNNTAFLYGLSPTDFNFQTFNTGSGGLQYSLQNLFDTFVFDDELGIITVRTTLNYGNFLPNSLTKNILPFILAERTKVIASTVNRSKSQYRVFFSDGYALWVTMVNQQYLGALPVLFPNPVFCCDNGEDSHGTEVTYFGSSDGLGYVYQIDVGTSFDGENIDAFITLAWDAQKSPRILKQYRAASIEVASNSYANISFGYSLGYGTSTIAQPGIVDYETNFASAPLWDVFVWDNFIWDGETLVPTEVDLTGTAENIQVTLSSTTDYIGAYNINSVIYHLTQRRGMRV